MGRDTTQPIALRVPQLAADEPVQALVSLTAAWIEQILQGMPTPSLIVHLLRALALIDRPLAEQYAKAYELSL